MLCSSFTMRAVVLISLLFIVHTATGTVELQKLTEKVATGLKTLKEIKETAKAKIHKLAGDIDLHKLHQLDVLNIFHEHQHISAHPPHPIHPPKFFVPHHHKKEHFVVDPYHAKHYFEHEREHLHVHHIDH